MKKGSQWYAMIPLHNHMLKRVVKHKTWKSGHIFSHSIIMMTNATHVFITCSWLQILVCLEQEDTAYF